MLRNLIYPRKIKKLFFLKNIPSETLKNSIKFISPSDESCLIVIPVSINNSQPKLFHVDTGANHTLISQKLAEQLNLKVKERGKRMPEVIISSVKVMNFEINNIKGRVVPHFRGLSKGLPSPIEG